jgi:hypothetical protein
VTEYSTQVLVASRLSELCRKACAYAGLPTRGMWPAGVRFVVRSGQEPAELLVKLLQEALAEEAPEIAPAADHVDPETLPASQVLVREGFDSPCPIGRDLEQLVSPGRPRRSPSNGATRTADSSASPGWSCPRNSPCPRSR